MAGQVLASTPGSTGVEELLQLLLSDEYSIMSRSIVIIRNRVQGSQESPK